MTDHLVHDAIGGPLTGLQAAAAIAVGTNGLMVIGVMPVLLGALADAHRLTAAGIGQTAMIELLGMGVATGLAGAFLRPARLRFIGLATAIILTLLDLGTGFVSGAAVMAVRGAAGVAEGLLLWITVGMIIRTITPERWSGVYFTAQCLTQLMLSVTFATWVLPRFGATGGFIVLAGVTLVAGAAAIFTPGSYARLPNPAGESGAPPPRGWVALFATVVLVTARAAVALYLQPLAHQAGLSSGVARTANWVGLAAQTLGGTVAMIIAGRVRYFAVFVATSTAFLIVWYIYFNLPSGEVFVAATAASGFFAVLLGPFLTPFTIEADPSRRAAMQTGAAQILGGSAGPFLASLLVTSTEVRGVLGLSAGLLIAALVIVAGLRFTKPRT